MNTCESCGKQCQRVWCERCLLENGLRWNKECREEKIQCIQVLSKEILELDAEIERLERELAR